MHRPVPAPVGPGQESVWAYPRPPRVERTTSLIEVVLDDIVVASTRNAWRVLETSHPPTYYVPPSDIGPGHIRPSSRRPSYSEFKGIAVAFHVEAGDLFEPDAAWGYPRPSPGYEVIADHVAFFASRMDGCYVDGELVEPQPGGHYGGWITSSIVGPFKGGPGSAHW